MVATSVVPYQYVNKCEVTRQFVTLTANVFVKIKNRALKITTLGQRSKPFDIEGNYLIITFNNHLKLDHYY
ncbi:hypothetical protein ACTXIP_04775 [Psychrobacter alimentarius]|uniref:hypothetical protein n=1 Tax=Psychrobacter alimentarius TaxID=261164 RepID=UPI003FD614EC